MNPMDHNRFLPLLSSFTISQAIVTAIQLGIFECLGNKSRDVQEIALMLALDEEACERILVLLTKLELVNFSERQYSNSEYVKQYLLASAPDNLLAWIDYSVRFFQLWQELPRAIRFGQPQWQRPGDGLMWQSFFQDDASKATLVRSFEPFAKELGKTISQHTIIPANSVVLDLGGGSGKTLIEVILANPASKGILFDLPAITPFAEDSFKAPHLKEYKLIAISGNFLIDELVDCDVIIMAWILHDWNDEQVLTILRKCYRALSAGGMLLVAETILDGHKDSIYAAISSLDMLLSTHGRERTMVSLKDLFHEAGFQIEKSTDTNHQRTLIQLRKSK